MKSMKIGFLLIAVLSGCATVPPGPDVRVLPPPGKSFDTFRAEDARCREWAEGRMGAPSDETVQDNTTKGAVVGTAAGAGIGALFGAGSGHAGVGALVGAASGLLVGTAAGASSGQVDGREAQHRYDNAYAQCMYSYGNEIPGYRQAPPAPRPAAVVPPPPPVAPAPEASPPPPAFSGVPEDYSPPEEAAAPPEVYIEEAPQFIYSPDLNAYVAVGVPYDLVYAGGAYYCFSGGRWYRSAYYNGPWVYVPRRSYPRTFVTYRVDTIRAYRDREYRVYVRDRDHYAGRFHRPEYHAARHRPEGRERW